MLLGTKLKPNTINDIAVHLNGLYNELKKAASNQNALQVQYDNQQANRLAKLKSQTTKQVDPEEQCEQQTPGKKSQPRKQARTQQEVQGDHENQAKRQKKK